MDESIWTIETQGDVTILNMTLDNVVSSHERDLFSEFKDLLKEGRTKILIDLTNTTYLASMGIGFLVFILKNTKKSDCDLVVTGADEKVMKVLKTAGVDVLFDVIPDRQQALARLS